MKTRLFVLIWVIGSLLAGCTGQTGAQPTSTAAPVANASSTPIAIATSALTQAAATALPATSVPATPTRAITATPAPSATPQGWIGPDVFPPGINPLTGLQVSRPELLDLPPAGISVTNFPVTARPQAGLSAAAQVYEFYVGIGMTRYLAVYYGDLPKVGTKTLTVGPIRSGRLPYEPIRNSLGGFLLIANSYEGVVETLHNYNFLDSGSTDVLSVFVDAAGIEKAAREYSVKLGKPPLTGNAFSVTPPDGGKDARMMWIPYSFLNQVIWRYDAASGAYQRYQDNYDGTTFIRLTDRLSAKPLAFQDVVVVFADHIAQQESLVEINLAEQAPQPALLLRDGKIYSIFWTTARSGNKHIMRFIDSKQNPVPLKPGQTWVEVVSTGSEVFETVDSPSYNDLHFKKPGSGNLEINFIMPKPLR